MFKVNFEQVNAGWEPIRLSVISLKEHHEEFARKLVTHSTIPKS